MIVPQAKYLENQHNRLLPDQIVHRRLFILLCWPRAAVTTLEAYSGIL